ncbi:MAG: HAMP domain-containing protein, partial [Anaerolineaceae bacterium]|nr:HAMP domain-containing protein [Anaerolineaceae bacterium]
MRSLTLKLVLAFLFISLIGTILVAVFARQATVNEFDQLMLEKARTEFVAQAAAYYQINSSWAGVGVYFQSKIGPPAPQPQDTGGQEPLQSKPEDAEEQALLPPKPQDIEGQAPLPRILFVLVDQNGRVVVPAGPFRIRDFISVDKLEDGAQVEVDGQVVGTALSVGAFPDLNPEEERFLKRANEALLKAALVATAAGLLLGILLAGTLTRPLRDLTAAVRSMAEGRLKQDVQVRSQDELGELTRAFNQMSAELTQVTQSRRQMTADIAHDLGTPITVIAGYIEALRDDVLQPSQERFDVIHTEVQYLRRLVGDLRTLSLTDAGELKLERQAVSPLEFLAKMAAAHWQCAEQRKITLQVQGDPDLPVIDVDPDRMAQVLSNLVVNALRHTPEGGWINLSTQRQGDYVQLCVQDSGEGIPPESLERVFDRFYRA